MGQMEQRKGCLDEKLAGIETMFFILTKGTCSSLLYHRTFTSFLTSSREFREKDCHLLLADELFTSERGTHLFVSDGLFTLL